VTSEGHPNAIWQRTIRAGDVTTAEALLLDMGWVPLEHARALVELYAEKGSSKYERAALKYLSRYLVEADPSLADVAQIAGLLAERHLLMQGR
jgi:hypothetical protein